MSDTKSKSTSASNDSKQEEESGTMEKTKKVLNTILLVGGVGITAVGLIVLFIKVRNLERDSRSGRSDQ